MASLGKVRAVGKMLLGFRSSGLRGLGFRVATVLGVLGFASLRGFGLRRRRSSRSS